MAMDMGTMAIPMIRDLEIVVTGTVIIMTHGVVPAIGDETKGQGGIPLGH